MSIDFIIGLLYKLRMGLKEVWKKLWCGDPNCPGKKGAGFDCKNCVPQGEAPGEYRLRDDTQGQREKRQVRAAKKLGVEPRDIEDYKKVTGRGGKGNFIIYKAEEVRFNDDEIQWQ